ncbi:hypothetical protein BC828DRAFT_407418 [Blastocladiella britannica]|nr:hypothetical protein BC828DRAFT_407418 [Blastocladiella britannica]
MVFAPKSRVTPAAIVVSEHMGASTVLARLARNLHLLRANPRRELSELGGAKLPHRGGAKLLHHNFVSTLLNGLFGVQTRGGCMCTEYYGQELLQFTLHEA